MGAFASRQVILLPFPYSDLSAQKLRPALILANAGRGDLIMHLDVLAGRFDCRRNRTYVRYGSFPGRHCDLRVWVSPFSVVGYNLRFFSKASR